MTRRCGSIPLEHYTALGSASRGRPGVTLMEVLVAITITGVGLLALLTLFPLGALEMAQSVKDDRCGHAKHNAAAIANILDMRKDTLVKAALLDPGGGLLAADAKDAAGNLLNPDGPSYPVYLDPVGWNQTAPSPNREWVAGLVGQAPRRITCTPQHPTLSQDLLFLNPNTRTQQLYRWNLFLDEINFRRYDDAGAIDSFQGLPCQPGGLVERSARYSWAYLLQMPKVRIPTTVDLTVIIYSGRPLDDPATGEKGYTAIWNAATSNVTLEWNAANTPPDVQLGTWIMDATMVPARGKFHRVVGVTQTSPTTMDLELLTPPRGSGAGIAVVMDNVIEVYERGDY